jgi:SAM-dependent methyltransferase
MRTPIRRWHLNNVDGPLGYAMRLLILGDPVSPHEADLALGAGLIVSLLKGGLLNRMPSGHVWSPYRLSVVNQLFLICDDLARGGAAVMGAGDTTITLCRAAYPSRRIGSSLDLGCGAGTVALLVAAHAQASIGTDVNPRAVELANINRHLNRLGDRQGAVRFLVSDLFDSLRELRFDLVAAQPPFVPRPTGARPATYLYGGARGDELPIRLLSELPEHLTSTGRAVLLIDWPVFGDKAIEERVREAVGVSDVSILVIQLPLHADLDDYCIRYASFFHPKLGPAFERTATHMREHLDSLGICGFQPAIVVLKRDEGCPPWVSTVHAVARDSVTTAAIDALITARHLLARGDDALLSATLRVPVELRVQRETPLSREDESTITLRCIGPHMLPPIDCNPASLDLVQQVNTAASVADAVKELMSNETTPRSQDVLAGVRAAVLRGLLKPVPTPVR